MRIRLVQVRRQRHYETNKLVRQDKITHRHPIQPTILHCMLDRSHTLWIFLCRVPNHNSLIFFFKSPSSAEEEKLPLVFFFNPLSLLLREKAFLLFSNPNWEKKVMLVNSQDNTEAKVDKK